MVRVIRKESRAWQLDFEWMPVTLLLNLNRVIMVSRLLQTVWYVVMPSWGTQWITMKWKRKRVHFMREGSGNRAEVVHGWRQKKKPNLKWFSRRQFGVGVWMGRKALIIFAFLLSRFVLYIFRYINKCTSFSMVSPNKAEQRYRALKDPIGNKSQFIGNSKPLYIFIFI